MSRDPMYIYMYISMVNDHANNFPTVSAVTGCKEAPVCLAFAWDIPCKSATLQLVTA